MIDTLTEKFTMILEGRVDPEKLWDRSLTRDLEQHDFHF